MEEYCSPEDATSIATPFRMLYRDVCPLTKNKLFESTYGLQSSCAQKCLQDPFCAGYNFNKKKVKPNCQLTHTLDHHFGDCNINDKGWIFYHPLAPRKVPCNKMKRCKHGGKTIIDLRNGPGSNPYRCKCPKGVKGDLCETTGETLTLEYIYLLHSCLVALAQSVILFEEPTLQATLSAWIQTTGNWTICWRATRDGWSASTFHGNCDHKKPTVTIIKTGQYIFGGYATESWEGKPDESKHFGVLCAINIPQNKHDEIFGKIYIFYAITGREWKQAPGSFIFSLRNKENLQPFIAQLKDQNTDHAIYAASHYGPTFGRGHDIFISNNAASNVASNTQFNNLNYQTPPGVSNPQTILAGTSYFTPSEIEVFYILQN
ncbi:uncharacterized protein LOC114531261 [Dendronephthya gigantea]|uniref:uncharacterized protein LOC114531261 n=1 Tax=Dendronephthya gigantea TaxID=151771 RepID=UPI00106D34BD|nr:uncharacterized protein LOC114531261 [Dendronephthya gigantea]